MSSWKKSKQHCIKATKKKNGKEGCVYSSPTILLTSKFAEAAELEAVHEQPVIERTSLALPPAEDLVGTSVFRLSNFLIPYNAASEESKEMMEKYGGSSGYRQLLRKSMNSIELDMKKRIQTPVGK